LYGACLACDNVCVYPWLGPGRMGDAKMISRRRME
jgi:hypothetical protein